MYDVIIGYDEDNQPIHCIMDETELNEWIQHNGLPISYYISPTYSE